MPITLRSKRSNSPQVFALIGAVCALLFTSAASAQSPARPTVSVATELGLTPESLALAGIDTSAATAVLNRVRDDAERQVLLETLRTGLGSATVALFQARALVAETLGDDAAVASLDQAQANWESAKNGLDAARADFRASALLSATELQRQTIARWSTNAARRVPPEFKVIARTDRDWRELEQAARAEARATRRGTEVPSGAAELLATARAEPSVSTAKSRHAALRTALDVVFASFVE